MTLTELRYLVAVARERHFGRAAQHCHVSQPTLSVGIRRIEQELGITVFERSRTEVRVTAAGQSVIDQASRVLNEADVLRRMAEQSRDPLRGPLRLGAIYTIGPYLFPHLMPALHRIAPDMPLVIEENFTARLAEQLRNAELDAILIALPFSGNGIQTRVLYEEPFRVVMPVDHPWATRKSIRPEALAGEQVLLLGANHCFRDQVLTACPDCGMTGLDAGTGHRVAGSSLETIRHMVASGMGITVLPATAVDRSGYGSELLTDRPFSAPSPRRQVALAWRSSYPRPEAIDALVEAIHTAGLRGINPVRNPADPPSTSRPSP